MKRYKAIFFDWDGTAVTSRTAPTDAIVKAMVPLLDAGVRLAIISGTTYDNIAGGNLHRCFTSAQLNYLYLGLGRGALDYGFTNGDPIVLHSRIPETEGILHIHDACYRIHRLLLEKYRINTDIVFSRPNYCKIDLLTNQDRGESLFLQAGEVALLDTVLHDHGIDGAKYLIELAESFGTSDDPLKATTDAKYLEVGSTGKCDNVDAFMELFSSDIRPEDCCFWGDEFVGVSDQVFGSDSGMITARTRMGNFFDVSNLSGDRPMGVCHLGGGVNRFLQFLDEQSTGTII